MLYDIVTDIQEGSGSSLAETIMSGIGKRLVSGSQHISIARGTQKIYKHSSQALKRAKVSKKTRKIACNTINNSLRKQGKPYSKHKTKYKTKAERKLNSTGDPNTSVDFYDEKGILTQRRYYGSDGKAKLDIDYDHSNGDGTHIFPHRHEWDWSKKIPRQGD